MRIFLILSLLSLIACSENEARYTPQLSEEFKDYWYSGKAEITSYKLEQARYGEIRNGEAVLIYVTEDFLREEQVKANSQSEDNISVLKLNYTKNFLTGIYPYSIMQSSFYPLETSDGHAIKVSASIQEWCGQVYMQLNNRDNFRITSHSYFQGEADKNLSLEEVPLENELWNQLRVEPNNLPVGDFEMIPSFEYLRLSHKPTKAYPARGEYYTIDELNVYKLEYPELNRTLKIYFERSFPYHIEKWEETYVSGFGKNAKEMTTSATRKARIKSDYWNKNSNKNLTLRQNLELN